MLNRLYIVIGMLAILLLTAGFVIPRFIDWGNYRARLEQLAETNLGTEVIIEGEIKFSLLPQPVMSFGRTIVGDPEAPILEITGMEAEFSLMDFLRDQFVVTGLAIDAPVVSLSLDESGNFVLPFDPPDEFSATNISVASANISGGQFILADTRSEAVNKISDIDGELRISGISGPFSFQGDGDFADKSYALRVGLSEINGLNQASANVAVSPHDQAFSFTLEGLATVGETPSLKGKIGLRVKQQESEDVQGVRGDLILVSDVDMSAEKLLLSAFTMQPDENRPATRLTGAVVVDLGADAQFDAVLSGGIFGMTPRSVLDESDDEPYALISLLSRLPAPPELPLSGRLGVDVSELDLQAFSLRNVQLDANYADNVWSVDLFKGDLAGDAQVQLQGRLATVDGLPDFDGAIALSATRLDALGRLWGAGDDPILFNVPLELNSSLSFREQQLGLANGELILEGDSHSFAGLFDIGAQPSALLSARFAELSDVQSRVLGSLLPAIGAGSDIWRSFPHGSIDVAAQKAHLLGFAGEELATRFEWNDGALMVERVFARELGGVQIDFGGQIVDPLGQPQLSGAGHVGIEDAGDAALLSAALDRFEASRVVRNFVEQSLPLQLNFEITPRDANGEQVVSALGVMGVADVAFDAALSQGLLHFSDAPLQMSGSLSSVEADAFAQQFGLAHAFFDPEQRTNLQFSLRGTASNSFELNLALESGEDSLGYGGSLLLSTPDTLSGSGRLDVRLASPADALSLLGTSGLTIGAVNGQGEFSFSGVETLSVTDLVLLDDDERTFATGQLTLNRGAGSPLVVGQIAITELSDAQMWASLFGPASQLRGDGIWYDGPLDLGPERVTRSVIDVSLDRVFRDENIFARNLNFTLSTDDESTNIRNLSAEIGAGSFSGSLNVCCANQVAQKQLSVRGTLDGVDIGRIAPSELSRVLSGALDGSFQVTGTGASFAEIVASLAGSGSFESSNVGISHFSPTAFGALDAEEELSRAEPQRLVDLVEAQLTAGPFLAPQVTGTFALVAGRLSANNIALENETARLFGDLRIDLNDGGLGGDWLMSPMVSRSDGSNEVGLAAEARAQIGASLAGNLANPDRRLDANQMVDAIMVVALERELAELEQLRIEQEERAREAAEERARLIAAEAERQAAEAERLRQEEEARALAAEAARRAAEEAAQVPLNFDFESQDPLLNPEAPVDLFSAPQ